MASPNMNLIIPVPTQTLGPLYAEQIAACFNKLDSHNHTFGEGSQIPLSALTVSQALPMNNYPISNASYVSLAEQITSPTQTGSLYMQGGELYFRNGAGTFDIKMTNGPVVNVPGTAGFAGLLPPASATYAGSDFVFQSGTNIAGNLDAASIKIRNTNPSSNAITISAPNPLPADYSLTLPSAGPSVTSILQFDSSGNASFIAAGGVGAPTGTVSMFAGSAAPSGWLICDGSTLDSVANPQYAALYAVILTTYGGTGADDFNLPDCRGVFVRGVGSQTISGETYTGTLAAKQVDNLESHNHGGTTGSSTVPVTLVNFINPGSTTGVASNLQSVGSGTISGSSHTHSISASGSGTETYPANIALNYIIKL